jgi:hypothetical protein
VQLPRQYDIMFANNAIVIYSSQAKNIHGISILHGES